MNRLVTMTTFLALTGCAMHAPDPAALDNATAGISDTFSDFFDAGFFP